MPNFLNGIVHLPFLGTLHYHFRDVKMQTRIWSANSIEPVPVAVANHFLIAIHYIRIFFYCRQNCLEFGVTFEIVLWLAGIFGHQGMLFIVTRAIHTRATTAFFCV